MATQCQAGKSSQDKESFTLGKFSTSSEYLDDANKLYSTGKELLTGGQVRRGREMLRGAQQQLDAATLKLTPDLNLPNGPMTEVQVMKSSALGSLALFTILMTGTGYVIGGGHLPLALQGPP